MYGLTLYGTFLANKIPSFFHLVLSAALFASVGFTSVTLWTLFGAGIRKYLNRPKVRRAVNIVLALLLVYTGGGFVGAVEVDPLSGDIRKNLTL